MAVAVVVVVDVVDVVVVYKFVVVVAEALDSHIQVDYYHYNNLYSDYNCYYLRFVVEELNYRNHLFKFKPYLLFILVKI